MNPRGLLLVAFGLAFGALLHAAGMWWAAVAAAAVLVLLAAAADLDDGRGDAKAGEETE